MDRIRKTVVSSGAVVITEETHVSPVVALRLYVRAGSLHEAADEAGLAHFLEHLVFRGSVHRPGDRIVREIEALGGEINAWTSYELTSFHALVGSRHLLHALDALCEMVALPGLPPDSFDTERKVVLEEIGKGDEQPDSALENLQLAQLFGDHPLGRPIYGSPERLGQLDRQAALTFHQQTYRAGNLVIVAVGDLDPGRLLEAVEARLRPFPGGPGLRVVPPAPPLLGPRVGVALRDVEEARFGVALRSPAARDERSLLADLLALALGGSENAVGYRDLVRDRALLTDLQASTMAQGPGGALLVQGWASPDRPAERLRALCRALAAMAEAPLERAFLDRLVRRIANDRVFQRETVEGEASRLGANECAAFDPHHDLREVELLRSVTPGDLVDAARDLLKLEGTALAAVVPDGSEAQRLFASGDALEILRQEMSARRRLRRRRPANGSAPLLAEPVPGLRVAIRRDPTVPIVSCVAAMPGGARFERPEQAGVSTLLADVLTRGTARFGAQALLDLQEEIGGGLSGFSGRNSLGVQFDFLAEHATLGLDVLADVVFRPRLSQRALDLARRLQLEDLRGLQDAPLDLGTDALFALAFDGHPYGLPALGRSDSLRALSRADLVAHHRAHVAQDNLVVAIVGDIDPERAMKRLGQAGAHLPARVLDALTPLPLRPMTQVRRRVIPRTERKSEILLGFSGVSVRAPERYAMEILTTVLAGQCGRLFTRLREDHGDVYDIDALSWEGLDAGLLIIGFGTAAERARFCLDVFWQEVARILDAGLRDEEVARAKQALVGGVEISFQRRGTVAHNLAYDVAYGLGAEGPREFAERVFAVGRDQVEAAARASLGAPGRAEVLLEGAQA